MKILLSVILSGMILYATGGLQIIVTAVERAAQVNVVLDQAAKVIDHK